MKPEVFAFGFATVMTWLTVIYVLLHPILRQPSSIALRHLPRFIATCVMVIIAIVTVWAIAIISYLTGGSL